MTSFGNLLWLVFGGGLIASFLWALFGFAMVLTVIGIPFAVAAFRIAGFAACPFGRELIDVRLVGDIRVPGTDFVNFLWMIFAGIWLAVIHVLAGISLSLTIIGIPFGIAHFKLAQVCFAPLGKKAVSKDLASHIRRRAVNSRYE